MVGTKPASMQIAVILFFMMTLTGIVLGVIGGSILDILENEFYQMGMFDVTGGWDTYSTYRAIANLFYVMPYLLPLLGIFILLYTIYQRYGRDRDIEEYDAPEISEPPVENQYYANEAGMYSMEMYKMPPQGRL